MTNDPVEINRTRVLSNGAVHDGKRIISGPTKPYFTAENGAENQKRAIAKKRMIMAKAANSRVQPELVAEYGADAHIAERAIALQLIATTPESGKAAVMAHSVLIRDCGLDEPKQPMETQHTVTHVLDISPEVADLLAQLRQRAQARYIDADTAQIEDKE